MNFKFLMAFLRVYLVLLTVTVLKEITLGVLRVKVNAIFHKRIGCLKAFSTTVCVAAPLRINVNLPQFFKQNELFLG